MTAVEQPFLYRALIGAGFVGLAGMNLIGAGKMCNTAFIIMKNCFGCLFDQFREKEKSTPLKDRIQEVKQSVWDCIYLEKKNEKGEEIKADKWSDHAERVLYSPFIKVVAAIAMYPLLQKLGGECPSIINKGLGYINVQIISGPLSGKVSNLDLL